ncbi:hypothetical protein ACWEKT_13380 [Nocardia takedensis]
MSDVPPYIGLTRQPNTAILVLGVGTVPGRIDRIALLSDGSPVSSRAFAPPFDVSVERLEVELLHNGEQFVDPVVEVLFRRPQPDGELPVPPTRVGFRLTPGREPDFWGSAPVNTAGSAAQNGTLVDRYWATLDFGTSRAVGAIRNNRNIHRTAGILPRPALARVAESSGITFSPKRDPGLTIDFETDGDPEQCAALWRTVLNTPPLEHRHLHNTRVYSSDIVVDNGRVELTADNVSSGKRIRGVKRHLLDLDKVIPGTDMTGIEIYRQIYERFIELVQSKELAGEPLTRIFVTYPTKLPPDVRARLKSALEDLVDLVELDIDEAVAAAGFFIMRRFGTDPVLGAEAFKLTARSPSGKSVWDDFEGWKKNDRWHENLLVVDVGGGTTDCALVKMLLVDQTPGDIRPGGGRFYRLQPEVRSSGGRMHLGGDLLTLAIFRRLKNAYGVPSEDTKFLDAGTQEANRRRNFDVLWDIAEQVKVAGLGGQEPIDVLVGPSADENAEDGHHDPTTAFVPVDSGEKYVQRRITVRAEDLAAWVEEPLKRIGALAAGIAAGGLTPNPDSGFRESVDHVLFSGGSLQSEYLRNRIEAELRSQFAAEGLAATFEVAAFDDEYCKTGTALGGMYLNAIADAQYQPEQTAVRNDLNKGIPHFRVDTSHLRVNLAANFHVEMEYETVYPQPAFRCGQPLHQDGGGRCYAEAGPYPLGAQFHIHRFDIPYEQVRKQTGEDTLWASSNFLDRKQAEELGRRDVQLYYEIDEREQVTLLLSVDAPGWHLEGPAVVLADDIPALIRRDEQGSAVMAIDLFPNVEDPAAGTFDQDALIDADTPLNASGILIPVETSALFVRDPGGQGYLRVAKLSPERTRWISIDTEGNLRLHDRRPDRSEVTSPMALIDAQPGQVFALRLRSTAEYDIAKDPFGGTH